MNSFSCGLSFSSKYNSNLLTVISALDFLDKKKWKVSTNLVSNWSNNLSVRVNKIEAIFDQIWFNCLKFEVSNSIFQRRGFVRSTKWFLLIKRYFYYWCLHMILLIENRHWHCCNIILIIDSITSCQESISTNECWRLQTSLEGLFSQTHLNIPNNNKNNCCLW